MGVSFKKVAQEDQPTPEQAPKPKAGGELAAVLAAVRKDKGERVAYAASRIPPVERIPTGILEFDLATGGGWPKGRVSQVYGPESSGKSNLLYRTIAQVQRLPAPGNKAVLFSLEGTEDPAWMAQFGIDLEALTIVRPGYGEEAVDLILAVIQADDVAFVGVDSIAMLTTAKEIGQTTEKYDVGSASVLIKRLCNKIAVAMTEEQRRDHFPTVLFVNQTRMKIGVMFGDPEYYPGGQTLRFLLALNVRLYGKNKAAKEIHPELPVYKETVATIKKAKVGVLQSKFEYDLITYPYDGLGVGDTDSFKAVADHLKAHGTIVPCKGGWEYEHVVFPTQAAMRERYLIDGDFRLKLQSQVIASMGEKMFYVEEEKG